MTVSGYDDPSTLIELISLRAERDASRIAYRFLEPCGDGTFDAVEVTFGEFERAVRAAASAIARHSEPGDRVVLLAAPGLDYIYAFFGCIYAGRVPVPAYPPTSPRHVPRLFAVIASARAQLLICDQVFFDGRESIFAGAETDGLGWLSVAEFAEHEPMDPIERFDATPDFPAFLQYTSGSTSDPKGVVVTHGNIIANAKMAVECFDATSESVCVSWLPPYHDMGLIGGIIFPLYVGGSSSMLSPLAFVRNPESWLQAISRYRATHSPGPNFAYRMCVERISPDIAETLDLSSWTHALCGAEPVDAEVLNDFADRFAARGFSGDSFYPCYGMAETTLVVSGARDRSAPISMLISVNALATGRISAPRDARDARSLVSSGRVPAGTDVVVVDRAAAVPAATGTVGELWVRGPSVAAGYFELPEATEEAFARYLPDGSGPFLATGDLGVVVDGQVYITGRASDLIIIRGRNIYPQDIELSSSTAHLAVHGGRSAAFAGADDAGIVVVQELSGREADPALAAEVAAAIRARVAEEHSLAIETVVLIGARRLPLTSSGKVRRKSARAMFAAGELRDVLAVIGPDRDPAVGVDSRIGTVSNRIGDRADLVATIVTAVAAQLGREPATIGSGEPFAGLGLDSVKSVRIAQDISTATGSQLPPTALWEHPSIDALADHLICVNTVADAATPADPTDEQVAVIGIGCRFPGGVSDADQFWELLTSGTSGIIEVPADRWSLDDVFDPDPGAVGRTYSRHGGFVPDVADFDAGLFGISPREAVAMDPQHRLMLEVSWSALEHAGIAPDSLRGSRTGVFVGMASSDYAQRSLAATGTAGVDAYGATGNAVNFGANRVSYTLGLAGPSLVVDTACSSSLTALHLGCASLRSGESELVLVGGVNVLAAAATTVALSQGRMLSASGQCKTFDVAADGYVRGEGCGVVVLKRLSAALADGDRVLAVVRGTAVNQDGRSNGLTAPNGLAQQDVVREALARAGVAAAEVGYVEAHGTGTPLGDPIEVRALAAVLGAGRPPERPLMIGSVKTNIGHLEAAAGIAGLIKTVLVLDRGVIPPHRNLSEPNPHIDWSRIPVRVTTELTAWSGADRTAGVSSFGFGGTNAHAVLGAAPAPHPRAAEAVGHVVVKLAAGSTDAVRTAARDLAELLVRHPELTPASIAAAAGTGRADLPERAAVVAATTAQLLAGCRALADGEPEPVAFAPRRASGTAPRVAFVVPGHGADVAGALAGIYGVDAEVTATVDDIAAVTAVPVEVLVDGSDRSRAALRDTTVAQPALYAVAVALGVWWRRRGIEPEIVLGHSVGAYAAAALAGVFSVVDGARIIGERARLVERLMRPGRMAVAKCSRAQLAALDPVVDGSLTIAVSNGPDNHVLAGQADVLSGAADTLSRQGVELIELPVTRAFHTSDTAAAAAALGEVLSGFALAPPTIALISDTSGAVLGAEVTDPGYWAEHTSRPVDFAAALDTLLERGIDVVLELGPGGLLRHVERAAGRRPVFTVASTAKDQPQRALIRALAHLWMRGARVDWSAATPAGHPLVSLPGYPFERRRYWIDTAATPVLPALPAPATAPPPPRADFPAGDGIAVERMRELLRTHLADALGIADPTRLSTTTGLFDLGLTSAMVVELRNQLETATGLSIPSTAVFDHPSIERLADYLAQHGEHRQATEAGEPVFPAATAGPEPIAIVGLGCRFPGGADDPAAYWRLLCEGLDATSEVPVERWRVDDYQALDPQAGLGAHPVRGGFLTVPIDGFDAEAFGIAPTEARSMDPQQRLLLEVAGEALDDAGYRPEQLAGSATGVFIGLNTTDYLQRAVAAGVAIDPYLATGNTFSVAAGRLSYLLGLQGPSMAVDTACSSSLVALHLAVRSLRTGESDAALVGGVNLMLAPATTVSLSKLNALAPDGRCKPFSAAADGYGRGEGCGVVVLKRLSDARAAGDRVWAVVRGSAVNQDGRSAGLTVPHGPSQHAVITAALRDGAVRAEDVGYVEAHGTGTPLGDPIEMNAMCAALRPTGSRARPLLVGSAKSNLGHLEAAAGIAGLIKVVLMSYHRKIPATLHHAAPSSHIDWQRLDVTVPTELRDWPGDTPPLTGVSSFGFSGTNAHVVVESAPDAAAAGPVDQAIAPGLLVLSGRTDAALRETAAVYRDWLRGSAGSGSWAEITRTAAVHRPHHPHRLALVARSAGEAADRLADQLAGQGSAVRAGAVVGAPPRLIFVFGGQGTQWPAMGATLLAEDTTRTVLLRCAAVIRGLAGWSLIDQLTATGDHCLLDRTEIAQPAIVAVQIALVERWREWGVVPDAIVGHSIGEIGAAYCAGALTLESAITLAVARGQTMRDSRGHGAMIVVGAGLDTVRSLIAELADTISVAAVNSPVNTVLAGARVAIDDVMARAEANGLLATRIQADYAFHSYQMTPLREQLISAVAPIAAESPRIPCSSTVTGALLPPGFRHSARYWADNLSSPVLFQDALLAASAGAQSVTALEIGPQPVLRGSITQCLDGADIVTAGSMNRDTPVGHSMLTAAATLHTRGHHLDHARVQPATSRRAELPTYRWQRQRHWLDTDPRRAAAADLLGEQLYDVHWVESTPVAVAAEAGDWLIVGQPSQAGERLGDLLAARGATVRQAAIYASDEPVDGELIRRRVEDLVAECLPASGVLVVVTEADAALFEETVTASCAAALGATTGAAGSGSTARVWLLTSGAVEAAAAPIIAAHTPVWGLGRVLALEHPDHWGGQIDIDPAAPLDDSLPPVLGELLGGDGEDQIAVRAGRRLVARLRRVELPRPARPPLEIADDRAYLITGGRGTLGLRIADWLAGRGARELILLGRSELPASAPAGTHTSRVLATIERLRRRGVTVHTPVADVADETGMASMFDPGRSWSPIGGVVHAAGAFTPAPIGALDWPTFAEALTAKVTGTRIIESVAADAELDFLLLYSSGSSVWGSALAGHYAAANYYLDMTAHRRSRAGAPTYAVNWGWFADSHMGAHHDDYFRSMGLAALPDALACDALDRLLGTDRAQLTVAPVDWSQFKPVLEAKRRRPLLADFTTGGTDPAPRTEFATDLAEAASAAARVRQLTAALQREVATVLGHDPARRIDPDLGFFTVGMDSLTSVALKRRLDALLGVEVPATAVFEHPTITALGDYLLTELLGYGADQAGDPPVPTGDDELAPLSADELLELLDQELEDHDH